MMPPSGTFAYVFTAPGPLGGGSVECDAALWTPVRQRGDRLMDRRLVGYRPRVRVTEAGVTPEPSAQRPFVLRCQITLIADHPNFASVAAASFHVDKAMMAAVRAGDRICLARSACAGLGLSIVRDGRLVAAAGAVTQVPLANVHARVPMELIARAEAVFREVDPNFSMPRHPLAVEIDGERAILTAGTARFGDYRVTVEHGFLRGIPGTDECVSIYDVRACPDVAAHASALLMKNGGFLMQQW